MLLLEAPSLSLIVSIRSPAPLEYIGSATSIVFKIGDVQKLIDSIECRANRRLSDTKDVDHALFLYEAFTALIEIEVFVYKRTLEQLFRRSVSFLNRRPI